MEIVITGGAGFIGTNLVNRLSENPGVSGIRVLDDFSTGVRTEYSSEKIAMMEGDVRDLKFVETAFEGAQSVVHLGALPSVPRSIKDPFATNAVNVLGTLNVLEAARRCGVGHVVSASSSSVYGANTTLPKSENLATFPLSPYAVSKLATEAYTNAYSASYGLATIAFRFFNVFGPLQRADHAYAAVIPRFVAALKENRPLTIYGDGTQSRDFTSVHSVTHSIEQVVLGRITSPTPVNLAFGSRTTLNELVALLEKIHGAPIDVTYEAARAGDVPHSQANGELLSLLVPRVEQPSLEVALREVYEWYMDLP
jgi:UDP-glucose 4-epimerase